MTQGEKVRKEKKLTGKVKCQALHCAKDDSYIKEKVYPSTSGFPSPMAECFDDRAGIMVNTFLDLRKMYLGI